LKVEGVVEAFVGCKIATDEGTNSTTLEGTTTVKKSTLNSVGKRDLNAMLAQPLVQIDRQVLAPLLESLESGVAGIEALVSDAAAGFVQQLLLLSAQQIAGQRHPGRKAGDIRWHGSQRTSVPIGAHKVRVMKPRLRASAGEVVIPVHQQLKADPQAGNRLRDIVLGGLSTRQYEQAVVAGAQAVGLSKSAVSRQFVQASAAQLSELNSRSFEHTQLLVIYVDGMIVAGTHVIAAVGVDQRGTKHVLGLKAGATENAAVVGHLLTELHERGIPMNAPRLWVIDGSKALASAIERVCGAHAHIQRCRVHKLRNAADALKTNKTLAAQTKWQMSQAFAMEQHKGLAKLQAIARQLKPKYPDAGASVMEGAQQMFTLQRLGIEGELAKSLSNTNVIESVNSVVRATLRRVKRFRDCDMALRWAGAGFMQAQNKFRKLRGHNDMGKLKMALKTAALSPNKMPPKKAA
jgi:putative transposase